MKDHLAAYFKLERFPGSSVATEVRAGLSTFLTMVLHPAREPADPRLHRAQRVRRRARHRAQLRVRHVRHGRCSATLPFGLAPGMGLSAYLAFGLVQGSRGMTSEKALTCCFLAGVIMALSALSGLSTLIMKCIPKSVKLATVTGMGLLIALIGSQAARRSSCHVESARRHQGGRTPPGLTSLTIAVLFVVSVFFAPLFENVPPVATSPVLIIVGAMMMGECVNVECATTSIRRSRRSSRSS
ncbi:hypothetical protein PINS_up018460 [Pythium insidiosum]|nr:hypothetical protein PINS_up018460 [Pythium insidiosum]